MTSFVVGCDVIYHSFPINSQYLMMWWGWQPCKKLISKTEKKEITIIIIINNKKESPVVTPFICTGCTCIIYVHVGLSAYQKKAFLFITTGGLTNLTRLITVQCLHVLYFKLTFCSLFQIFLLPKLIIIMRKYDRNVTPVSNVCESALTSLFWAPTDSTKLITFTIKVCGISL